MTRRETLSAIGGIMGVVLAKSLFSSENQYDGLTSATAASTSADTLANTTSRVLLVLVSLHHKNTEKLASTMAKVLNAQIKTPQQITAEELNNYDLIGFGSGIYDQKHHQSVLDLVDKLPKSTEQKRVFIYSTSGVSRSTCLKHSMDDPHTVIRKKLLSKNSKILGEYNCTGWNTNSFLRLFGGINKGKPSKEDLVLAEKFALNL